MRYPIRLLCGLASLAFAPLVRADVIVVDSGGGGAFTDLQPAVDAAQEGDTLLVKAGVYGSFTVSGKSLTIAAEDGAKVSVSGTVTVTGLALAQEVVVSGLSVQGQTIDTAAERPGTGLIVSANAGPVRFKSCVFVGASGVGDGTDTGPDSCCDIPGHDEGWHGAVVGGNLVGVAFVDCTITGGRGANSDSICFCGEGGPGGDGLVVQSGLVALYDSTVKGGQGGANGTYGGTGGAGCRLLTSPLTGLVAPGSSLRGGEAGTPGTAPARSGGREATVSCWNPGRSPTSWTVSVSGARAARAASPRILRRRGSRSPARARRRSSRSRSSSSKRPRSSASRRASR